MLLFFVLSSLSRFLAGLNTLYSGAFICKELFNQRFLYSVSGNNLPVCCHSGLFFSLLLIVTCWLGLGDLEYFIHKVVMFMTQKTDGSCVEDLHIIFGKPFLFLVQSCSAEQKYMYIFDHSLTPQADILIERNISFMVAKQLL